ncbi:hypothetical protein FE257_009748 [Aspergillus nanangensis]|uniref:YAG7-like dimerisation domain-containing protein n=1 Tax=Aspergillus nanangensis TaxID=2582783 RepID=A0AAD4CJH4_ASPNN|nr:hypothetical protein FE257_009748 [Aspergillus nanangensis]
MAAGSDLAALSANGVDSIDSPYFKELQRNLRNAMKKLNATAKVDAIIAEHPGQSLDSLVAAKKINTDQKAQALKKPSLQASVVQLEDQIAHFKQFASQYEERLATQKAELEKAHQEELKALKEKATAEAGDVKKDDTRQQLLSLSKFLCAAAAMRRSGDETARETRAFEGILYQVYGGSSEAVDAMVKLIDGAEENIVSVEGETLDITYANVKDASKQYAPAAEEATTTDAAPASDPTISNAGFTELQDSPYIAEAAPTGEAPTAALHAEAVPPPAQTIVSDAANPVAEASWDPNASDALASSTNADGWVEVPRDPAETETGFEATPASGSDLKNNEAAVQGNGEENVIAPKADGGEAGSAQHQRQPSFRGRGRGRGRGEGSRGRGRGEFRGRGGRGRGGRGRGGPNGAPAAAPAPAK